MVCMVLNRWCWKRLSRTSQESVFKESDMVSKDIVWPSISIMNDNSMVCRAGEYSSSPNIIATERKKLVPPTCSHVVNLRRLGSFESDRDELF